MFYIRQIQKDDCGFACLKMVLANINKDKNYLFLPQDESHGPYNLDQLTKLGKDYGVNFTAIKVEEKETVVSNTSYPFIACTCLKNGAKHVIVVTKIKWKRVFYADPIEGKGSMSLKNFLKIWDGTGLLIESFEKMKCPHKPVDPIKLGTKIGVGLVQLISGIFAVLGVYFIKDNTPIYLPAIFLSLAIVTELIMKALSYSIMKKLDGFFFKNENLPKKERRNYLIKYEDYKRLSLASPMNYILLLVFALGLIAVVLLNDIKNALLIATPLAIALIDVLCVKSVLKAKKREILLLEDEVEKCEDFYSKVKEIHTKSYNYSYIVIALSYVYAGLIVLTVILTMHICGITSFPYIVFYSMIAITLYKTLERLFSFGDTIEELNIAKIKVNNSIGH